MSKYQDLEKALETFLQNSYPSVTAYYTDDKTASFTHKEKEYKVLIFLSLILSITIRAGVIAGWLHSVSSLFLLLFCST